MRFNISLAFANLCMMELICGLTTANKNRNKDKILHIKQISRFSSSKHKNEFFKILKKIERITKK